MRRRPWARPLATGPAVVLALLGGLAACSGESGRGEVGRRFRFEERVFSDSAGFATGYWERPIPLQGEPPEGFSALETSLDPSVCGTCHAQQYADWQTSLHAAAYSPGLSGQLVNWENYDYQSVRDCLLCHAPLSEQSAQIPDTSGALVANPYFDPALQRNGLVCAGCHLRGWRRYGAPRRDGSLTPSAPGSPHGGVTRTAFFEDSRFCSGCHQFAFPAPNGKSLQNTYEEWRGSRYAALGVGCQGCHMPGRRHLWRGVHDSAMVSSGVTVSWVGRGDSAAVSRAVALRVTNSGTGHRFPTYVTPEVTVRLELLGSQGGAIAGTADEAAIRRVVEARAGVWVELSDTRLPPDSSLTVRVPLRAGARFARGTVVVHPDAFYERLFRGMLAAGLSDTSRALISEAHRRASGSAYAIFNEVIPLR